MYPGVGTFVLIRPTQTFYERIKLRYRHGLEHLADRNQYNPVTEVEQFLSECSDEHYLDFIEMFFQSEKIPMYFSDRELSPNPPKDGVQEAC